MQCSEHWTEDENGRDTKTWGKTTTQVSSNMNIIWNYYRELLQSIYTNIIIVVHVYRKEVDELDSSQQNRSSIESGGQQQDGGDDKAMKLLERLEADLFDTKNMLKLKVSVYGSNDIFGTLHEVPVVQGPVPQKPHRCYRHLFPFCYIASLHLKLLVMRDSYTEPNKW